MHVLQFTDCSLTSTCSVFIACRSTDDDDYDNRPILLVIYEGEWRIIVHILLLLTRMEDFRLCIMYCTRMRRSGQLSRN